MADDGDPARGMAYTEGDGQWGSDGEFYAAGPAKKRKVRRCTRRAHRWEWVRVRRRIRATPSHTSHAARHRSA